MPFVRGPDGLPVLGPDGQPLHVAPLPKGAPKGGPKGGPKPRVKKPITYRTLKPVPARKKRASDRETSPDKRVSFGRRLVRGPTPAYSRNKTPSRSSLARHDTGTTDDIDRSEHVATLDQNDAYGPSEQLLAEEQQATSRRSSSSESYGGSSDGEAWPLPVARNFSNLNRLSEDEFTELKDILDETRRDNEVCRRAHLIRAIAIDTAQSLVYDNNDTFRKEICLEDLCGDARNAQLVRYIGCLAQGGPKREESWRELLVQPECRVALIVGIIGTALKEHVFSELWFGGTDEQIEELEALQERQKHGEGYERTKQRAKACKRYAVEDGVRPAARQVSIALQKLLSAFYSMGQKYSRAIPEDLSYRLADIVEIAGDLSRHMRRCGDAVYHWPPTFKDEEFDPDRMECINIGDMISNSPFENKIIDGYERSILKEQTQDSEAIVKIVAFPGLVVHRQGGGALAKRLLKEEKDADDDQHARVPPDVQRARRMAEGEKLTGDEGFRTRVLCKSVVHLIWGRQRLLTREAGTSAHIDAMRDGKEKKYQDDRKGYIELYDYFLQKNPDASR